MTASSPISGADLRGATRLAIDATLGVTDLVEAAHARIARAARGSLAAGPDRARGIAGFVYGSVRGVTRAVGAALALAPVERLLGAEAIDSFARDATIAALNGVIGDHLEASGNPLAQTLQLRAGAPRARMLVLAHGLCMNDRQWSRDGHDHGRALEADAGWSAVHLRYNSGRAIGRNGLELARELERLADEWPLALEEIAILGYSMGGLVARAALHHAIARRMRWPAKVRRVVFLGTPHHGAPLERGGYGIDRVLEAHPLSAPFARLGKLRSRGIVDLRHGQVLEESSDPVPLPPRIRFHAIAGSSRTLRGRALGDGLVPVDSALGRHADRARDLGLRDEHCHVERGVDHLSMLGDSAIYARLRDWLA